MRVNLVTLGCAKNLVDSEKLLRQLKENGHTVLHNENDHADAVIVNTCGFILDAKTESVDTVLSWVEAKKKGLIRKLIVMGCLSERYRNSLRKEIPEVDGFFGVYDHEAILTALGSRYYAGILQQRVLTTPSHYAYLKISEGCNRRCAFCAIPSIRGRQRSETMENLVQEATFLAGNGVKELLLIAQDLTSYGTDIYHRKKLPQLLEKLTEIPGIEWVRLHYTYPLGFPAAEIIDLMKAHPEICRYLDIPVQHVNDGILQSMRRGHGRREIEEIIGAFRKEIPGIIIRTTAITGFPGEGTKEFEELKMFIQSTRFDRLGVFTYSHEEKTPAANLLSDDIPEQTKRQRMEELMTIQEKISLEKNTEKIGTTVRVIIDGREGEYYTGRTEGDSPGVDNEVLIPAAEKELNTGHFYDVLIREAGEFDLFGSAVPGL